VTLKEMIKEDLANDLSPKEIIAKRNCSKGYLSLVRNEYPRKRFTIKAKFQAAYLWGCGDDSIKDIATKLGYRCATIEKFLKAEGFLDA
jgi:AraC-like DNA-binding protein